MPRVGSSKISIRQPVQPLRNYDLLLVATAERSCGRLRFSADAHALNELLGDGPQLGLVDYSQRAHAIKIRQPDVVLEGEPDSILPLCGFR